MNNMKLTTLFVALLLFININCGAIYGKAIDTNQFRIGQTTKQDVFNITGNRFSSITTDIANNTTTYIFMYSKTGVSKDSETCYYYGFVFNKQNVLSNITISRNGILPDEEVEVGRLPEHSREN